MGAINTLCAAAFAVINQGADLPYDHGYVCVQPGDTISELLYDRTGIDMMSSDRYVDVIKSANPQIDDINKIQAGQVIVLPEHFDGLMCAVADQENATTFDAEMCAVAVLLADNKMTSYAPEKVIG